MAFVAEAAHRATDAEWAHVEPLIPPARCGGNRRHVDVRQVVNGLMYVLSTGLPMARRPEGTAAALDAVRLLRPLVPPPRLHPSCCEYFAIPHEVSGHHS